MSFYDYSSDLLHWFSRETVSVAFEAPENCGISVHLQINKMALRICTVNVNWLE